MAILKESQNLHLGYAHTGAQRTLRTDSAHGDKRFFPLLATRHRTLIRSERNGKWEFRLGGESISLRPARPSDATVKISLSQSMAGCIVFRPAGWQSSFDCKPLISKQHEQFG